MAELVFTVLSQHTSDANSERAFNSLRRRFPTWEEAAAAPVEEIADAIRQARSLKLDRRKVQLEEPIRNTGTHMVTVEVHDGVTADVKTIVTAA